MSGRDRPIEADPPPVKPVAPDPAECCGEGCVHCVMDVHDAALERYEAQLAAWRQRHPENRGKNGASER